MILILLMFFPDSSRVFQYSMRLIRLPVHSSIINRWFCSHRNQLDERYADLVRETGYHETTSNIKSLEAHDVLVVHPKIRWGENSASKLTDSDRQLDEAVALVNTLPNMRVAGSVIVGTDYNTKRKTIWGSGRIEWLKQIKAEHRVTAMMINVEQLNPMQQTALYEIFNVAIFDRYNVVLEIFKQYAKSDEAKLQIELAEIPYIKRRLHYLCSSSHSSDVLHVQQQLDRTGADKFEVLRLREQSIRKKLRELADEEKHKTDKMVSNSSLVAVVGYTNAGKTTLVKRLTGSTTLQPMDRLFATLDTTKHLARLPSGRKAIFADTIGFLSDLPLHLLSAFEATLAHLKLADVVVHLRDISHPDWRAQSEEVIATLERIGVGVDKTKQIITVNNKMDRVENSFVGDSNEDLSISCTTGEGVEQLIQLIDKNVILSSGCKLRRLSLRLNSPSIPYLYKEGFVTKDPLPKDNHLIFDVIMNDWEFVRFQKNCGMLQKKMSE